MLKPRLCRGFFKYKFSLANMPQESTRRLVKSLQNISNWARKQEPLGASLIVIMTAAIFNSFYQITKLAVNHFIYPSLRQDSWGLAIRDYPNTLHWLLAQHNEHRIFLSKLIAFAETELFLLPPSSTALLQGVMILISSSLLIFLICRNSFTSRRLQILTTLACILILTNPWQYENLYWEFQTPWLWSNFLILVGSLILIHWNKQQKKLTTLTLLIIASIIPWAAIYSIGQGIAVAASLCLGSLYKSKKLFLSCLTSTGAALIIYFIVLPYKKPIIHPPLGFNFDYLSKILFGGPWQGLAILVLIFAIYILLSPKPWQALVTKESLKINWGLLLPGIFTAIFAIMTTISRSGFGIEQAASSRYVSHSMMLAISAVLITSNLIDQNISNNSNHKDNAYPELLPAFAVTATTIFSFPQILHSKFPTDLYGQAFRNVEEFQSKSLQNFKCPAITIALNQSKIQHAFDCKELLPPDPSIPFEYFNGKLKLKPLGWHSSLVAESRLNLNTIRNNIFLYSIDSQNQDEANEAAILKPLDKSRLHVKGWGFLSIDSNINIFIIAEYQNGNKHAYPVNQQRVDVKTLFKLRNSHVGFDAQIPTYNGNSVISRILLASKYGSTQLPISTNSK